MKKVYLFLLVAVLLVCVACAALADVKPGEEVTVTLSLSNTNAAYVRVVASYDKSVFDLVGYSANSGTAGSNGIVMYNIGGLPSGAVGTVTLKVKDGAAPGTYTVGASLAECYDINEDDGSASVSGGSVTVAGNATPAPTTKPTKAPTAKPTKAPTSAPEAAPTDAPTAEPTAVPTEAPAATEEPTPAPTEAPAVDPTKPQYSATADFNTDDLILTGAVAHKEGTAEAPRLFARITYFMSDGSYTVVPAPVSEDGSFESMFSGNVVHIAVQVTDAAKVVPGTYTRFGGYEFDVE